MKKALILFLHPALSHFEWYRKMKGGKWFLVYENDGYNTIDGANQFWTQAPGDNAEILKEMRY